MLEWTEIKKTPVPEGAEPIEILGDYEGITVLAESAEQMQESPQVNWTCWRYINLTNNSSFSYNRGKRRNIWTKDAI